MTHTKPATKPAKINSTSQFGALVPMPRGRLDDADFRIERARAARAAQDRPAYHLRQALRAGLDHADNRWALRITTEIAPLTPAEITAARHLAAALTWLADLDEAGQ